MTTGGHHEIYLIEFIEELKVQAPLTVTAHL